MADKECTCGCADKPAENREPCGCGGETGAKK